MFEQVLTGLGSATAAVYQWFWDFLEDGYGNLAITVVLGMVAFCIIFRFILMPLFGRHLDVSGFRYAAMSDLAETRKRSDAREREKNAALEKIRSDASANNF